MQLDDDAQEMPFRLEAKAIEELGGWLPIRSGDANGSPRVAAAARGAPSPRAPMSVNGSNQSERGAVASRDYHSGTEIGRSVAGENTTNQVSGSSSPDDAGDGGGVPSAAASGGDATRVQLVGD